MKEDFLYYLWSHRLFDQKNLKSVDGETLEVVFPGFRNDWSGPDFAQARIRVGDTLWVGNVEIHVRASDWYQHGHQHDDNYSRIVLHVVYENDLDHNVSDAPTLELLHRIPGSYLKNYGGLMTSSYDFVACENSLESVPEIKKINWVEKMYLRRLERKLKEIEVIRQRFDGNWDMLLFVMLARAFGANVNSDALEQWACSLPLERIKGPEVGDDLEALGLGLFGFLDDSASADEYVLSRRDRYRRIREDLELNFSMSGMLKFYPVRPDNFPTLRIAQLAAVYRQQALGLPELVRSVNLDQMRSLLDMKLPEYWNKHYIPGKVASRNYPKLLSSSFINQVLINALIPVYFAFWKEQGQLQRAEGVLDWMSALPPEGNSVTRRFSSLGWTSKNALESQGLLEMRGHYCQALKCMECPIAGHLLRHSGKGSEAEKKGRMSVITTRSRKAQTKNTDR